MSRRSPFLLLTILAVGMGLAQRWEFEQLDTLSPSQVTICRHPDGRARIGYRIDGQFWLAWKDSVWRHESTACDRMPDFCIGADGTMGFASVSLDAAIHYAARTDTGWRYETLPWRSDGYGACLGIEPSGQPGILYTAQDETLLVYAVLLASRTQDSWRLDTIAAMCGTPGGLFAVHGFAYDTLGRRCGLYRETDFDPSWEDYLYVFNYAGSCCLLGGYENTASGVLGLEPGGKWAALFSNDDRLGTRLYYRDSEPGSGVLLDSAAREIAVTLDTAGRPQILYAKGANLHFGWRQGTTWRILLVPRTGVRAADLSLSDSCQPVIAFSDAEGVWLARGIDVVGTDEEQPFVRHAGFVTTICRRVLVLPRDMNGQSGDRPSCAGTVPALLLDATGRVVMDLKPGENDIRHLAPGVYFIRRPETEDGRPSTAVSARKVVIQG